MKKLEVILSQAIDEDFLHRCFVRNVAQHYTKSVNVLGKGNTDPKLGDEIWPQMNNHYMIIVEDAEMDSIREVIASLRKEFPHEGIACFITPCEVL